MGRIFSVYSHATLLYREGRRGGCVRVAHTLAAGQSVILKLRVASKLSWIPSSCLASVAFRTSFISREQVTGAEMLWYYNTTKETLLKCSIKCYTMSHATNVNWIKHVTRIYPSKIIQVKFDLALRLIKISWLSVTLSTWILIQNLNLRMLKVEWLHKSTLFWSFDSIVTFNIQTLYWEMY